MAERGARAAAPSGTDAVSPDQPGRRRSSALFSFQLPERDTETCSPSRSSSSTSIASTDLTLSAARTKLFRHKKSGVLKKRGFAWRRKWVERHVVLHGRNLTYFEQPEDGDAAAFRALRDAADAPDGTDHGSPPHDAFSSLGLPSERLPSPRFSGHQKLPPYMSKLTPRGALELTADTVVEEATFAHLSHCFAIRPPTGPVWFLQASSEAEQRVWVDAVSTSVTLIRRASSVPSLLPNQGRLEDHYDLGAAVKRFTTGAVCVARHKRSGRLATVRRFDKSAVMASETDRIRLSLLRAVALRTKHPSVLRCDELYDDDYKLSMVFPTFRGTNLLQALAAMPAAAYTERVVASVVSQLASALAVLHPRGLVHRNLTWANIRLTGDDSDDPTVVLLGHECAARVTSSAAAAAGSSATVMPSSGRRVPSDGDGRRSALDRLLPASHPVRASGSSDSHAVVQAYMAALVQPDTVLAAATVRDGVVDGVPAVLDPVLALPPYTQVGSVAPEVAVTGHATPAADMWALGVLLYTLLVGYPPPAPPAPVDTVCERLTQGAMVWHTDHWAHVTQGAKRVLAGLLCPVPEKRTTAAELLKHPWVCHTPPSPRRDVGAGAGAAAADADAAGAGASAAAVGDDGMLYDFPLEDAHDRLGVTWAALTAGLPSVGGK